MHRFRTNLFRRHRRPHKEMPETCQSVRRARANSETSKQDTQTLTTSDREARLFALRHLASALPRLEHGVLDLEHLGFVVRAFEIRNIWRRLLTEYVDPNENVHHARAVENVEEGQDREEQLDEALDEIGMALIAMEATMARWEWATVVDDLRREVAKLFADFGKTLPMRD